MNATWWMTLLDGLLGALIGGAVTAWAVIFGLRQDRTSMREERLIELALATLKTVDSALKGMYETDLAARRAYEAVSDDAQILAVLARSTHLVLRQNLVAVLPEQDGMATRRTVLAVEETLKEWLLDTSRQQIWPLPKRFKTRS